MMYDAKNGYGLKFTKYDEGHHDCIIYRSSKEALIRLADIIIESLTGKSLWAELNKMQTEACAVIDGEFVEPEIFKSKYEIPSYFINLLLKEYNMKVLGW